MGTQLELYMKKKAELAQKYASKERLATGNSITMPGGILTVGDTPLPGNRMLAIVLDAAHLRTFYKDEYDPDKPLPPICFSLNDGENDSGPAEICSNSDYFQAQSEECRSCPMNRWGSASKGKGKACGERRRLAVISAGYFENTGTSRNPHYEACLYDDIKNYTESDISVMTVPVTSVKNFSKFVHQVASEYQAPPFGVITEIFLEDDPKTQFKVNFEAVGSVEEELGEDVLIALLKRHEEAKEVVREGYQEPDTE